MYTDSIKEVLFTEEQIIERCKQLGKELTAVLQGKNCPLFVGILRGSVPFMAELMKYIEVDMEMDFMAVSSYVGTQSTGEIKVLKDLDCPVKDRPIIIVEDIIDTGTTLAGLKRLLQHKGASDVIVVTLLDKPSRRRAEIEADYTGFKVDDLFVVGYGLDFNQKYRNLPFIGVLKDELYM